EDARHRAGLRRGGPHGLAGDQRGLRHGAARGAGRGAAGGVVRAARRSRRGGRRRDRRARQGERLRRAGARAARTARRPRAAPGFGERGGGVRAAQPQPGDGRGPALRGAAEAGGMTLLALLRHSDTAWSAEGRIQGRSDAPLSEAGRAALSALRLPAACRGMRVVTSPLARCVETAALLGFPRAAHELLIAEMSWGAWEGRRLEDLRAELGEAMRDNEARGLDFRSEGGESPREVLARVSPWLASLSEP